ncbi:hypothetical protein PILCRDRAFT_2694 [Piloderma croceum F 1598]|uniref:Retrotransposon gag domain-containing protein n=1 Tax=Piloderma croceum (strain F 1598) TaxID=765440 RepID=A0A0C3FYX7_PILCF|nr:hypothetical protein PILCRDRAFT_2694 [Piloderma croceum F 1598]
MAYAHMFYGDYRRSKNPWDFLYDFEEHLASLPDLSESRKCEHFYLNCRSGFNAEEWYENFEQNSPSVITSWSTLRKHFCVKWLGASPTILLEIPNTKPVTTTQPGAATMISREMTITTTSTATPTPTNTTITTIYKTATPERRKRVADARHVIAPPTPISNQLDLETTTSTTTTDSNNTITAITQQDNEEPGVGSEEEERRVEKQNGMGKREAERREAEAGEQEGIEETQSEVRDTAPFPMAHTVSNTVLHEPTHFDWPAHIDPAPIVLNNHILTTRVNAFVIPIDPNPGDEAPNPVDVMLAKIVLINAIPVDPAPVLPRNPNPGDITVDPVRIAFANSVPVDPDPGDASADPAHIVLAKPAPIDPANPIHVDSVSRDIVNSPAFAVTTLALTAIFGHYSHFSHLHLGNLFIWTLKGGQFWDW